MIPFVLAGSLSYALVRLDKYDLPVLNLNGNIMRVVAVDVIGSPELLPGFEQRAKSEGWRVKAIAAGRVQVDPSGHNVEELAGLSFRIENGEFGDLRLKVQLMPDKKRKR